MDSYDVGIIGAGTAGAFACYKLAQLNKNLKIALFDIGRPMGKRKRQTEGFLGCMPGSDGKLYMGDVKNFSEIAKKRKTKTTLENWKQEVGEIVDLKIQKDSHPSLMANRRVKKAGYKVSLNNHIQIYPNDIHSISRYLSGFISDNPSITFYFDTEVVDIDKINSTFQVFTTTDTIECKKIIVCVGRSGWRWARDLYNKFDIIDSNDVSRFGIKVELDSASVKEFNESNCTISNGDVDIGPLCWGGTVIPEDHFDFAITSFRGNESRWETDKVSFNIIGNRKFKNEGFEQTNRVGQLTFLVSSDRVMKEKISLLMSRKSKISIIDEYDWLPNTIESISSFMPKIITNGYFHVPTIMPLIPKIKVDKDFMTQVDGMYCAGESSGHAGLLFAMLSGMAVAESM